MRRWLSRQILGVLNSSEAVVVLLDPEGVLAEEDLLDLDERVEVLRAKDWQTLRYLWDVDLRNQPRAGKVAIVLQATEFGDGLPLPWDIEEQCTLATVRLPVGPGLRAIFSEAYALGDALAEAWQETSSEFSVVAKLFEVQAGTPSLELESIARLAARYDTPPALWAFLGAHFTSALANRVALAGGDYSVLQKAWKGWLDGTGEPALNAEIAGAPGAILRMLVDGLLTPEPCAAHNLPEWAKIGAKEADPAQVVEELLAKAPVALATFEDWAQAAAWWGQIRYLSGTGAMPTTLQDQTRSTWNRLDAAFQLWLRDRYGRELLSSSATPKTLNRVATFLTQRLNAGAKVLLIVVDGLGFAQWHQVKQTPGLHVVKASACMAMLPTLTEISRQAIFAGSLPFDFKDHLTTTRLEEKHWRTCWKEVGLQDTEISYLRAKGDLPIAAPTGSIKAAAVVLSTVDDLLHDSNLLGDVQLSANLALWLNQGVLLKLVQEAVSQGYETWIISDHGNLECQGTPIPNQGDLTYRNGHRVLIFANETLRGTAQAYGLPWTPPGFPEAKGFPLFATGRRGFHREGTKVIHGGLSLDEVFVPLAQVTA